MYVATQEGIGILLRLGESSSLSRVAGHDGATGYVDSAPRLSDASIDVKRVLPERHDVRDREGQYVARSQVQAHTESSEYLDRRDWRARDGEGGPDENTEREHR